MQIAAPDEQDEPLEHGGEPHRQHDDEDELFADERPQEKALDDEAQKKASGERQNERRGHGNLAPGDQGQKDEGAERQKLAVGEVKHAGGLEDHDKAHGGDAVQESDADAIDQ